MRVCVCLCVCVCVRVCVCACLPAFVLVVLDPCRSTVSVSITSQANCFCSSATVLFLQSAKGKKGEGNKVGVKRCHGGSSDDIIKGRRHVGV